jgi:hypothetical protein
MPIAITKYQAPLINFQVCQGSFLGIRVNSFEVDATSIPLTHITNLRICI